MNKKCNFRYPQP